MRNTHCCRIRNYIQLTIQTVDRDCKCGVFFLILYRLIHILYTVYQHIIIMLTAKYDLRIRLSIFYRNRSGRGYRCLARSAQKLYINCITSVFQCFFCIRSTTACQNNQKEHDTKQPYSCFISVFTIFLLHNRSFFLHCFFLILPPLWHLPHLPCGHTICLFSLRSQDQIPDPVLLPVHQSHILLPLYHPHT